ncbi:MAG: phosphopantetheine-binding protein [Puniceicoccales bacterium]|nr:phosphopantetheine-binding protein [Puniceicoccales bacterium]
MMSNTEPIPTQAKPHDEEAIIRESLKRCSAETIEAALQFRLSGNPDLANTIVIGILTRFLEPEQRPKLQGESDHLRLMDDLGVDSLTMVEVIMLVEEILHVSIKNEDLRDLHTIGDVKGYVNAIARGLPPPEKPVRLGIAEIAEIMPHQPPFLFLQDAEIRPAEARGTYKISGQEFFLSGHFKDRPVFPASLQIEALGQLGVLFLLKGKHPDIAVGVPGVVDATKIFLTSCDGVRCTRICRPDDILSLTIHPKRIKHPLAIFEGAITVHGEKASFVEEIALTFDYLPPPAVSEISDPGQAEAPAATPSGPATSEP